MAWWILSTDKFGRSPTTYTYYSYYKINFIHEYAIISDFMQITCRISDFSRRNINYHLF